MSKQERRTRKRLSDDQLMAEARSLHHDLFVEDVINRGDLLRYDAIMRTLEKRGHAAKVTLTFEKEV